MGRHRSEDERVLGPYPKDAGEPGPFRLIFIDPVTGLRKAITGFATHAQALREKGKMLGEIRAGQDSTVEQILGVYEEQHLKRVKQNRPLSMQSTIYRLRLFFKPVLQIPIGSLDEATCKDLRTGKWKIVPGKVKPVVVVDGLATRVLRTKSAATSTSQLNTLASVRTFTEWCQLRGYLRKNPMAWFSPKMEPEREHGGKGRSPLSLTMAEKVLAVTFAVALEEKGASDIGRRAVAVAIALATGLRASTIVRIDVGSIERRRGMGAVNVDGDAEPDPWLLWHMRAKKRSQVVKTFMPLEEPFEEMLAPMLEGRAQDEPFFTTTRHRRGASVGTSKLTEQQVAIIRAECTPNRFKNGEPAGSIAELARRFGVSWMTIKKVVRGDTWAESDQVQRPRRDWVRDSVAKMCELAKVPRATAHQVRGIIASKYSAEGNIAMAQWMLRHGRQSTTTQSYASREAVALGAQRNILKARKAGDLKVMEGGRK